MEIPETGQRIAFVTDNAGTIIELTEPGTWPPRPERTGHEQILSAGSHSPRSLVHLTPAARGQPRCCSGGFIALAASDPASIRHAVETVQWAAAGRLG